MTAKIPAQLRLLFVFVDFRGQFGISAAAGAACIIHVLMVDVAEMHYENVTVTSQLRLYSASYVNHSQDVPCGPKSQAIKS